MRLILGFILIFILSSCASTTNYYTPTVNSWRGANINTLLKTWGVPDNKLTGPAGNIVLVYNQQRFNTSMGATSPSVGVTFTPGGTPIMTTIPNTNFTATRGMTAICTTLFVADAKGTITQIKSSGPCYANARFQASRQNPQIGN